MTEEQFRSGDGVQHGPFDYMAEADKTCSVIFKPEQIDKIDFIQTLGSIAGFCNDLNLYKKLLVRGKTNRELSLPQPGLAESIAVEFDPNNMEPGDIDILHGLVGAITEAGEMAELLMTWLHTGTIDLTNAIEECGDVMWYLARQYRGIEAASGKRVDFEVVGKVNINKLHNRHGEKFDANRDANRDLEKEREQLEADFSIEIGKNRMGKTDQRTQELLMPSAKKALGVDEDRKGPIGDCEGMDC